MKYRVLVGLFGLAMLTVAAAGHLQVSLDDIVLLNQRGVSDQTILLLLENRELGFNMDPDAVDRLLLAGVSDEIIRYLLAQATAVRNPADIAPPTTYSDIPADYPVTTSLAVDPVVYPAAPYVEPYPGYYYTPYYYGGSYSFGFASYPHTWFGHHSRAGHHTTNAHHGGRQHVAYNGHSTGLHSNQHNGHHATHTGRPGGTHTGGAIHTAVGGRYTTIHADNNRIGHNRQHATTAGDRHSEAGIGQTTNHGARNIGHGRTSVAAHGRTHVASHSGRPHVVAHGGRSHIGRISRGGSHSGGRGHRSSGSHSSRGSHRGGGHSRGGGHGGGH